ncbi:MAG: DUF1553 domain-containing protein [Bryobacterales bacterium]|nr:DUF1553 domain-containing protein [Bryobacterales bacterium]
MPRILTPLLSLCLPGLLTAAVDFNRDIRPILSDRCFSCHGPDAATKKIRLRLDSEAGMVADLGGKVAVKPGDPASSELIARITHEKPALRMPPAYSKLSLNDKEIALLKQWIAEGAKFAKHWSLVPPVKPALPDVKNTTWPKVPMDRFVLARLEKESLSPAAEADRVTWLRRASLDVTGLPPSLADIDAFMKDQSPRAYENAAGRLLASHHYGERMAARWLDVARYADTNGYQTDAERNMWRWRDWVIDAFNRNMPFDQFTVEQLAGDLLPNPTRAQKIATGFNRNHRGNGEGGIVPEEYMVEYAADRVETTSTVWLGLTVGCARCHNHKYDPLTQRDYYSMFAYFNNIPERGRYFKFGNTPPLIPAPTPDQDAQLRVAETKLSAAEAAYTAVKARAEHDYAEWLKALPSAAKAAWVPTKGQLKHLTLGEAGKFNGTKFHEPGKVANYSYFDSFTVSAWIKAEAPNGSIVTRTKDAEEEAGIAWMLQNGKLHLSMAARWLDDTLRTETKQPISLNQWHHVLFTYDGSRMASGIHIYIDGKEAEQNVLVDELNQEFRTGDPWRIGGGAGKENLFKGEIEEVRFYQRALPVEEVEMLALRTDLNSIARKTQRTRAEEGKLRGAFLEDFAAAEIRDAWKNRVAAKDARDTLLASFPTVMIMEEMKDKRQSHILVRGAYDRPGEPVGRAVPAALGTVPAGVANDRLALAKWLVSPENPLPARVIVNRIWQMYFGIGLVKTVEDFGSQGEPPSHPEMLDYLAKDLMDSGWDLKALQKQIILSATYRQVSKAPADLLQRDPENRLLARGPRVRLPAEMVRDQALFASGLLVDKVGGPSVKPYQPAGLWSELSGGADYERDKGESLYRRSLYTYWKRAAPPPSMMNFDAAGRETCIVRENRTNTPLQALNLMNDVTFVEASRKMAERMMKEGGAAPAERIAHGFRLATSRMPRSRELDVLLSSYRNQLDLFQTEAGAAEKFLQQGESKRDESLPAPELAAYATVASLILNLDETITKQ